MKNKEEDDKKFYEEVEKEKKRVTKEAYKNIKGAFDLIGSLVKIKNLNFDAGLSKKRGKEWITIKSENLALKKHILRVAWKSLAITEFGSCALAGHYIYDEDYYNRWRPDLTKKVKGSGVYMMDVCYRYSHIDGGSNGAHICSLVYNGKWELKNDYRQYEKEGR